jgi:parallel beta-helix repeat protein
MNDENGIEMEHCKRANITGNIISDNGECGIYLRGASHENVINGKNTIRNNSIGLKLSESNKNVISKNNFIDNTKQASFYNAFLTTWKRNYWDDRLFFLPEIIRGSLGQRQFPWVNFDRRPAQKPYSVS